MTRAGRKEQVKRCEEYRDNLHSALRYLVCSSLVKTRCEAMYANCSDNLQILAQAKKHKSEAWCVNINNWRIPVSSQDSCGVPGKAELFIEGYITTKDSLLLRQCITVSIILLPDKDIDMPNGYDAPILEKGVWKVVRRIHFDYDPEAKGHPRSHVQFGGNFERGEQHKLMRYELFERPKEPRIPYPPYDIVLCTDLILRQFKTPLEDIVVDPPWTSVCRTSEKLLLKGYFEELSKHINTTNGAVLHQRQLEEVDWL